MKRILIPVDFSEHTLNTCMYAFEIAKKHNSDIVLFHTYNEKITFPSLTFPDTFDFNPYQIEGKSNDLQKEATLKIDKLALDLKLILNNENITKVTIKTIVSDGDFEFVLNQYCEEFMPSIIIMGARGKDNSANIFGEVTTHVINHTKWPVLAVPNTTIYKSIKNIMFASSLLDSDDILIRSLYNKLEAFDVNIFCVHVCEEEHYLKAQARMLELKDIFATEFKAGKFNCDLLEGHDHHKEIHTYTFKNRIDLIAFLPHKTSLFQRLFGQRLPEKDLFNTNIPLLTLRHMTF